MPASQKSQSVQPSPGSDIASRVQGITGWGGYQRSLGTTSDVSLPRIPSFVLPLFHCSQACPSSGSLDSSSELVQLILKLVAPTNRPFL